MMPAPKKLWSPPEELIAKSNLSDYQKWLQDERGLHFSDYHDIWNWSVEELPEFWQTLWDYFSVIAEGEYKEVVSGSMPDTKWFHGTHLNYAEHIFRDHDPDQPAIIFRQEGRESRIILWKEVVETVEKLSTFLKSKKIRKGDCVVAYLPNIPEATLMFLACSSMGVIWSSCSPDFGVESVVDRFRQINPKILVAVDGYRYGGKQFERSSQVKEILEQLDTVDHVIDVHYLRPDGDPMTLKSVKWNDILQGKAEPVTFERVAFDHPIWVLYSSGTTGQPKAITHSTGGVLMEHLKYLSFHNDVKKGEKFFWYTTTGWMMWNFVQASMLVGATIVLYDGSPGYPDMNALWDLAEDHQIEHFGTSAPYILSCLKNGLRPRDQRNLTRLRTISSTGAPLPPEGFSWIYENIGDHIWLCSMSGGTDVCSAFVGGCPWEPVYEGEIQCRALGCAMESWDENGHPLVEEVGEMVITRPMPSMPVFFWGDENKQRYRESYFDMFEGIWRHGDWLKITNRKSLVILGRSDATLNRHGIRIGTAEIYRVVEKIQGIRDSLIVNLEFEDGQHYMPLFVVPTDDKIDISRLSEVIRGSLRAAYSPRHVPDEIVIVPDIPYTISGKKMEAPVKKILMGRPPEKSANLGAMKNPDSLDFFTSFRQEVIEKQAKS